uniref:Reverse transcriptase domain-containing protein n=1 Tax=Tanacetum cinerariifolium TaxID=118510 RepID=A0A6L2JCJ2_TANCI|nr:hypothetical protein [Tanacetum cinerariifolium]
MSVFVVVNHVMTIIVTHEPSYNQNYNDNYYSHDLPSFPYCDNCGRSHETFQCQPINQNVDFFGSDQIQTPQYPEVHSPSQETSKEVCQAKEDLFKSIQTFLEKFICIPFEEKPKILFQAWEKNFAIQYSKPENPNELFQKLIEDLKELAEYDNSLSRDRSIFLNDDEEHSVQNEESLENSSKEIATSSSNEEKEEPPQDFDMHQLTEECSIEICEEQKQKMKDMMLELVKICQQKELLCMHDNVEDLIESALNSKLLLINSQRLDNKKKEVKNVVEQPAERGNHSIESLQNFRVVHKSSISFKNTSQISSIHAVAPILSTKEPEYSPSMGYENSNTTPETESDEIIKSGAEELVPILSENEVTLEDKRECDMLVCEDSSTSEVCDDHSKIFSDSKNDDDISVYDDFKDVEYVEASLSDPEIVSVEEENGVEGENVVQHEEEEEESDNSPSDNFSPEFETFCNHSEETRSGNTTTHADNSLSEYDSFCFEIEPDQERLINVVKSNISDDSSNDPLLEEADLFFVSVNTIPPGIENVADDSEGDIRFLEELLIYESILSHESSDSNFEDNPSIPRPPTKPPDAKTDAREEIPVVMNNKDKFDEDYYFFMFDKVFSFLSAESEDTIFDPGFTPHRLKFSCVGYLSRFTRSSHPFLEISLGKSISLINIA